ncbi:MAG: TspO/MBR family protein [Bauldia sp.]
MAWWSTKARNETPPNVVALLLALAPVVAAAVIGNIATIPAIDSWYAGLAKASFNPPNAVFAPVWTLLYLLMAYAFFRVLAAPAQDGKGSAIALFLLQIALNAGWSWAFFGFRNPLAGLLVIVLLALAILATIRAFARIDRVAAILLVPYLAWVSFAATLNFEVWRLN